MAVVKVGAADGDVVRSGGNAVDLESAVGDLLCVEVVAAGRAAVARRNEDRLALGGSLLPERAPEGIASLAQLHFALAVADADDSGLVVFHGAIGGQGEAFGEGCARRGVEHQRGAGRDRACNLEVEIGFGGPVILAGVLTVHHHLGQVGVEPEECLVGLDEAQVHIRCSDDGDRLARTGDSGIVDRIDVILRGKISGGQREEHSAARRIGPLRLGLVGSGIELSLSEYLEVRLGMEAACRRQAGDDRGQRGRNGGFGGVGQARLAVDQIAMKRGLKGLAHLARGSGKLDGEPPGMNLIDGEAVRLQPRGNGGHIRGGRPVETAKLRRREPLVKGGIAGGVRGLDEIPESRLLRRGAGQQEQHPPGGHGVFNGSLIDASLDYHVHVTVKDDARAIIDRALNPRSGLQGGIARRGPDGCGGETQCNEQGGTEQETRRNHARIIG